ncbi:hypothetical protein DKY63_02285 [Pseudomonas putida]|uniref:Uncharacterized protein n=1 Tax=Pseudomonas putida TaxID=303 RepID=A0A2Z4RSY9_PSEPU|nr:hypothetical protein DKY63_02285 [Pseudomonas putida]
MAGYSTTLAKSPQYPVGASLLAMVVNDNAGGLTPRGVLPYIASRLAPTVGLGQFSNHSRRSRKVPWINSTSI